MDSFQDSFAFFGQKIELHHLNIILPVGISFYTFQTMSYSIDVYRNKIEPEQNLISFLSFVSFFPQLVAGPIERASSLLPQFSRNRTFDYENSVNGLKQILWGLFKKMVIADGCAIFVDEIYLGQSVFSGSTLVVGMFLFTVQIYCDFSAYSDIAIGVSKLFGFQLMTNFSFPYFSRNIVEFWRRWHISLSTWFRDYIYFPLGGSKEGTLKTIRNILVVFLVSGFWHGAKWSFIIWGAFHALVFIVFTLINNGKKTETNTVAENTVLPNLKELFQMVATFSFINISWIFFRSESLTQALDYLRKMFGGDLFSRPDVIPTVLCLMIFFMFLVEWFARKSNFALENFAIQLARPIRWMFYAFVVFLIGAFSNQEVVQFLYFQF